MENWVARLNGKTMPLSEARISPMDRGFLFGDAVYEAMRIYSGKAFLLDPHLARLRRSLDCLRIAGVSIESVKKDIEEILKTSGLKEAVVYLQISRGVAPTRSHAFPTEAVQPTVFMFVMPFTDPQGEKRRAGGAAVTQPDQRWGRVDIKTVNLLGNVLASQAAKEAGALEAILINKEGEVTEGTHTNVFGVIGGVLRTKPLSHAILPGISRDYVLDLARGLGIRYEERALTAEELKSAQELFLTATTTEVMPIVTLDGKPVGTGAPGPITIRLRDAFSEAIAKFRKSA
jgi:D-alanine transaminase